MKMSKKLNIVLIVILTAFAIALTSGLVYLINTDFNFNSINFSDNYSKKLVEEKEFDNIKNLDVKINVADLIVEEKNQNTIKVEIYSNNIKKYDISETEKLIKVSVENKKTSFINFGKSPYVKITVPTGYSKTIAVDSKVGDVKIKKLKDAILKVESETGDVKVDEIDRVTAIISVGDIKINKVNKLIAKSKTGDTKIGEVKNISCKNTTGDIKINKVKESMVLETKTGDIKVENATISKNSSIISDVGNVKIVSTKGCYVEAKTNVGDTRINNNDRKSDIVLTITSRIGDIKVNY